MAGEQAGREERYGTFQAEVDGREVGERRVRPELGVCTGGEGKGGNVQTEEGAERTRLVAGVAYGAASGTLSGLCLLFAKTGIELLILTVVGQNQVSSTDQLSTFRDE